MISKSLFSVFVGGGFRMRNLVMCSAIILLSKLYAQQYPDTIWIPVTFYDFHSDSSNPEFEIDHNSGLKLGMVADTLNANRKPVLGPKPFFNYFINKWFEPWKAGDFTLPVYQDLNGADVEIETIDHDTAFINVVIQDSLPFAHMGNGVYQFERSGSNRTPEFFWLDELGFENEGGLRHNFSFTMELHTTFTYNSGLNFEFLGDDDVWAFINGKLAMDIGGIHNAEDGEIELDDIASSFGLQDGKKYKFDFFYAERHTSNSRIKITTNLFTPTANLRLYPNPGTPDQPGNMPLKNGDTISAGEPFSVHGHAFDSLGWRPEWDSLVTLELIDPENRVKLISNDKGSISIIPEDAYGTIEIVATFINPEDPSSGPIKTTIELFIGPGEAHHINIQASPDINNWTDDDHRSSISITEKSVLYAVVRDSFGNFVRFADNAEWKSENQNIVTVFPENGNRYQGNLQGQRNGTTNITASEAGLIPATIEVTVTSSPNNDGIISDSAITSDADGNGYLDRIDLYFSDTLVITDEIKKLFNIECKGTGFEVDSLKSFNHGLGVRIYLLEKVTEEFQTDWQPLLSIFGNGGLAPVSNLVCKDGAGPVVDKAKYFPSAIQNKQDQQVAPDTIKVTISELINWPNSNPNQIFKYYQNGKSVANAFSSMLVIDDKTALLIVSDNLTVETQKDSIQLISSSGLTDKFSNIPHPDGRKAPVEWGVVSLQYVPSNSPFIPGVTEIPPSVQVKFKPVIEKQTQISGGTGTKGTIIRLEVKGRPLKPITVNNKIDGAYGTVKIYDVVGNVIRTDLYIFKVGGNDYGIYWDGYNKKDRAVGRGTYLFYALTTDIENKTNKSQFKIGVTR